MEMTVLNKRKDGTNPCGSATAQVTINKILRALALIRWSDFSGENSSTVVQHQDNMP